MQANPDFILWTGDNLPHTKNPAKWDLIYSEIKNITVQLKNAFPETQIIPCIGNHDLYPPDVIDPRKSSRSIYEGFLDKAGWNELLNKSDGFTAESFTRGGYYSVSISSRLRVIALNTVLWYSKNNLTARQRDPAGQFEWLEKVLNDSYTNNQQVYITGHVPPGFYSRALPKKKGARMYQKQFMEPLLSILRRYSKIIKGQFYGHFHLDTFQIFRYAT
ncbi:acid sphingomyelinase-like phosphodiesterase 3a, partial [Trichonephila clavata]